MLRIQNWEILAVFLMVAVGWTNATCDVVSNYYEETETYSSIPECRPSCLDTGIKCSAIGSVIVPQGGLYSNWELHFVPLASAYYVARMADAVGYQDYCPTNISFLRELDLQTPWSGTHGAIAVDGACGYERLLLSKCKFPTADYPFLCTGSPGTPGTYGKRLETLSYNSILQGANLRWALFIHCWRAKTPSDTQSKEIATSFNVFNMDPTFSAEDRATVLKELKRRGFNTDPSNLIEFDYSTTRCN